MKNILLALIMCIMCVFIHAQDIEVDKDKANQQGQNLANQHQEAQTEYIFKSMSNTKANMLMDCKCFITPSTKMDCTCLQKESTFNWYVALGLAQQIGYAGGGGNTEIGPSTSFGFEWMFHKSNGLNVSFLESSGVYGLGNYFNNILTLNIRYVYETKNTSLKYAVLTGFDFGWIRYDIKQSFIGRYNIGLRLRKKNHAVLFDVNIPLHNVNYVYSFYPIYPGITIGVSYVFFFGVKNDFYL